MAHPTMCRMDFMLGRRGCMFPGSDPIFPQRRHTFVGSVPMSGEVEFRYRKDGSRSGEGGSMSGNRAYNFRKVGSKFGKVVSMLQNVRSGNEKVAFESREGGSRFEKVASM